MEEIHLVCIELFYIPIRPIDRNNMLFMSEDFICLNTEGPDSYIGLPRYRHVYVVGSVWSIELFTLNKSKE